MIDPISAMAAVSAAVGMIKKAAATVEDVRSLGPLLGKYFDAKHTATKAAREAKKAGGSNMGKAIEIELALKQQEDFERELQQLFIYSGNADVWQKIVQRTNDMNRAEIEEERAERARAKRRQKEVQDAAAVFGALLIASALIGGIVFAIYSLNNTP